MTGHRPRAIVALDFASFEQARAMVTRLGESCSFYKVGTELFTAVGPSVVEWLREEGKDVFLDLKLHDIPNTVRGAARRAAALGVRLLTVHASGGAAMVSAAVEGTGAGMTGMSGAEGEPVGEGTGILAVTVLTSLDAQELGRSWGREVASLKQEVLRMAALASQAGAHGIVCAGTEASDVRAKFGDKLAILVPGIRLHGSPADDQSRTVTPEEAVRAGARYLVLGRTVTASSDPASALAAAAGAMEGVVRAAPD